MRRLTHAQHRDERGAVLVEFALILPLLMALLLGVTTGGLAYNQKISTTNAVREGARFGATLPESTTNWGTTVRAWVVSASSGELTDTQVCVDLISMSTGSPSVRRSSPCTLTGISAPAPPAGIPSSACLVRVWAKRSATLQAFFFTRDLALTGKSIARFERGTGATCS